MIQPLRRGPPAHFSSTVGGIVHCLGDAWGFNHPVPPTRVEILYRGSVPPTPGSVLATDATGTDGSFNIVVANYDLRAFPWTLRLVNAFTGETWSRNSEQILAQPATTSPFMGAVYVHFDAGSHQLPWAPMLPMLAMIGSRKFTYPAALARTLGVELRQPQSAVSLLYEFHPDYPGRDRELDEMFRTLAAESAGAPTGLAQRIGDEAARALRINLLTVQSPGQLFGLALKRIESISVGDAHKDFPGYRLGEGMKKAFGAQTAPSAFGDALGGLAAASVLIYAAGHVARQHKMDVHLSGVESMAIAKRHRHYKSIDVTIS